MARADIEILPVFFAYIHTEQDPSAQDWCRSFMSNEGHNIFSWAITKEKSHCKRSLAEESNIQNHLPQSFDNQIMTGYSVIDEENETVGDEPWIRNSPDLCSCWFVEPLCTRRSGFPFSEVGGVSGRRGSSDDIQTRERRNYLAGFCVGHEAANYVLTDLNHNRPIHCWRGVTRNR